MRLLYRRTAGFAPSWRDGFSGVLEHPGAVSLQLRLTEAPSAGVVSNADRARVFASVLRNLAGQGSSRLLFRYDLAEVGRTLKAARAPVAEAHGWLVLEPAALSLDAFAHVLELVAFTTCYLQIGGDIPPSPVELFNTIESAECVVTLSLFDETVEIVSARLTAEAILDVARGVANNEGITLLSEK